jgi:hypothetical protein
MKYIFLLLVILFTLGCTKPTKLEQKLNCFSSVSYKFNTTKDFNNNFSINIPTNWKTNLYYDNLTSEIYTADTLKELTKSFIIGISFLKGNLKFNNEFLARSDSIFKIKKLKIIYSIKEKFTNKPAYWYLVSGEKNGLLYHQLNITFKNSEFSYINATVDIYGEQLVNDRICHAISILKSIQLLQ